MSTFSVIDLANGMAFRVRGYRGDQLGHHRADRALAGLTSDTEIRSFLATQRGEVLAAIPPAEKVRLGTRLLQGWISDADIDAFEILYRISDTDVRKGLGSRCERERDQCSAAHAIAEDREFVMRRAETRLA